ncbi:MAG: hypothetical protein ACP5EQ_04460 [Candidatus Cloacimonadia bacterium]
MFTGEDALILFYGIFWATVLATIGRYRLFDTHLFFSPNKRRHAISRFLAAFGIINVAPILWLWVLFNWIVPQTFGALPIMSAAFASLSVFGFHRILHAVIATEKFYSKFYSEDEWRAVIKQWGRGGPNTFAPHFIPGLGFLIVFSVIAYAVGHL